MQHYRAALGEDGRGDSGSGDGSVVFEDGAARVVINKGARPESVDTTREKVDAEAVAHASESEVAVSNESEPSLEVRVLAAETAQKVAEAALGLAERQILHLRGNAHDANNSLVSVMGYLELTLMNDGLEGKVREDLEIVLRQATKVTVPKKVR